MNGGSITGGPAVAPPRPRPPSTTSLNGDAGRIVTLPGPPRTNTDAASSSTPILPGGLITSSSFPPSISLADDSGSSRAMRANVLVEGRLVSALVDTGASHSLIRSNLAEELQLRLLPWEVALVAADARPLVVVGSAVATVSVGGAVVPWRFGVVSTFGIGPTAWVRLLV